MAESLGVYHLGGDLAIIRFVSSANIASGCHAGDPRVMDRAVVHMAGTLFPKMYLLTAVPSPC